MAGPAVAAHDGQEDGNFGLDGEFAEAGIGVGHAAENFYGDAGGLGAEVGHHGQVFAFAEVGEDFPEEVGFALEEEFEFAGVAQLPQPAADEGVLLVAGDGEHVYAALGGDDAREFPVSGVRAGKDAAEAGMGRAMSVKFG